MEIKTKNLFFAFVIIIILLLSVIGNLIFKEPDAATIYILENNGITEENHVKKTVLQVSDSIEKETILKSENILTEIDINIATKEELMQLKGVGEVIADRIINYRENVKPFDNIEEIKEVEGIGDKIFNDNKNLITVNEKNNTATEVSVVVSIVTVIMPAVCESEVLKTTETEVITTTEATTKPVNFPLELNICTKEELLELPGIGEVLADRIIEYRNLWNGFRDKEELLDVKGIGTFTYDEIKNLVYVKGEVLYIYRKNDDVTQKPNYKININTATKEELMQLPEITESIANDIVEYRMAINGFTSIEELYYIPSMTQEKIDNIKILIIY